MKLLRCLWLPCFLLLMAGCKSKLKKPKARYTDYDYGYYNFYYHKFDSAFLYFSRYINNPDDSLIKGKCYRYMGHMEWQTGDLYRAQESLANAIYTLDTSDHNQCEELGFVYNILGNVSLDLKRYDEAIELYGKAMFFLKQSDYWTEAMNGQATTFQKKGDYNKAILLYDSILNQHNADQLLVARAIDNKAKTSWQKDPGYNALPEYWTALKIRADSQYTEGLNASYAHLADYYTGRKPDSALWYANQMRETAIANDSPDDILEAIDKLIRLSNSPVEKDQWYRSYKKLNDSLQLSRDTTRYRFALIRYDFQKSKEENLALQNHITRQRLLLYGLSAIAILIIITLYYLNNKRRKRIEQESVNAIRESKLKTSQKVHDVVANGLYRIMNELEHKKTVEKELLLDKIEVLYEKSRDISHEDVLPVADLNNQVHALLMSFDGAQTKVFVVGNVPGFWSRITDIQKNELQLVLTELMVNMKKHSQAGNVVVEFTLEDNKACIYYKDDGVGFRAGQDFGKGLTNTVSRIQSLNGDINFGKSDKAGVSISIRFPLQPDKL